MYEKQPEKERINQILSVISERIIDNGHCAKYKKDYYIPADSNGIKSYFVPKTKCLMIEAFDGTLYMSIGEQVFLAQKVMKHQSVSKFFDNEVEKKKEKKKYIPPMSHPWRRQNFIDFRNRQMHRDKAS